MNKKYKICFVTTIPVTIRAFILSTAEYLYQTGDFDISFVCDYEADFANELSDHFHYYPIQMERGINLSGIKACYEMYRLFRKEKFDLVQYSTPNASLYASIAAKFAGIRVRLYCQWGIAYVGFYGLKRRIFKFVEKYVCHNSTIIEPDSNGNREFSVKEKLYEYEKSKVIGYGSAAGVDLNKFNYMLKENYRIEVIEKYQLQNSFIYGFVGRLDKDKGVNELLEAFLSCNVQNKKLLIVGPDDKKKSLNQELLTRAYQCKDIIFTGQTNQVEKLLSAMDVLILPSYREGFGSVVIEALAMQVPVIATDIPGPRESVKSEHGILIQPKDSVSLRKAMEKIALECDLESMQIAGYRFVKERFDSIYLCNLICNDRKKLIKGKFINE